MITNNRITLIHAIFQKLFFSKIPAVRNEQITRQTEKIIQTNINTRFTIFAKYPIDSFSPLHT